MSPSNAYLSALLAAFTAIVASWMVMRRLSRLQPKSVYHLWIVLGSGGHTSEMISMLQCIDPLVFTTRTYLISTGDALSESKARLLERKFLSSSAGNGSVQYHHIFRARMVKQSLVTTPVTATISMISVLMLFFSACFSSQGLPDMVVCNGPGTCVPVCLVAKLLPKIMGFQTKPKIVFVESFARVKTLSLSGRLLIRFKVVDKMIVQWPELNDSLRQDGVQSCEVARLLV